MNKSVVVLLTGTINANNMAFTQLQDAELRKNQYVEAIRFWTKLSGITVVFVENSSADLSSYFQKEIETGLLELLSFNGNEFDRSLGKGYGELKCLEFAYRNSRFIKYADFVFKSTGRYKLLNFSSFLDTYTTDPNVNLLVDFKWNLTFCDSRFFGFAPAFIPDFLLKFESIVNDSKGIYFEHILCKAALTAIANDYIFKPLATLPRIEGYSGSSGAKYNSNFLHWFRYKFEYNLKHRSIGLGNLPWI